MVASGLCERQRRPHGQLQRLGRSILDAALLDGPAKRASAFGFDLQRLPASTRQFLDREEREASGSGCGLERKAIRGMGEATQRRSRAVLEGYVARERTVLQRSPGHQTDRANARAAS